MTDRSLHESCYMSFYNQRTKEKSQIKAVFKNIGGDSREEGTVKQECVSHRSQTRGGNILSFFMGGREWCVENALKVLSSSWRDDRTCWRDVDTIDKYLD